MIKEVFFDVETQKLFSEIEGENPADLKLSMLSVYKRQIDENIKEISGEMTSFWHDDLDGLWSIFQEADRIIGFNSISFDTPVLQPYASFPLNKLPHFDILDKVKQAFGRRLSLNALAKETLGKEKIDIGINAVLYWKQQDKKSLAKLQKYCEEDVYVTRDLYDYGLNNNHLKFKDRWNTPKEIEIDFSYPKEEIEATKQKGLF
ncbi:ribonuclease H-like domain-containing protein [Patescibacteria group bacterium]